MDSLIKRLKGNKTLINGGLFSLYSFMGKGISFLLLMLLANYIPPAEYGNLSLFNTIVTFVTIFMALNTEGYFSISYFKKPKNEFKRDFTTIYILGICTLLFFLIVIFVGGHYVSENLGLSPLLLFIAVFISFFTFSFNIQQNYFRVQENVVKYGYYNVGNAILNFSLSLLFVITFCQGWLGRVYAQLSCALVLGILSIITFVKNRLFVFEIKKCRCKEILQWGVPMIPHHATSWIRQGIDRYIINYHYSIYQVGVFSFALNVSNIIEMIGMAFNATNSVSLYKTLSNKSLDAAQKWEVLKKQTRNIGIIYIVGAICTVISMSLITYFLLPKYRESIPYFLILCVAGFLKCIYFLYCNYLFYYSRTKQLMYITFATSIMHLILSLIITRFSLMYTAIIYVFVQGTITLLVYLKSMKVLKNSIC